MSAIKEFTFTEAERAGIERAAQWHEYMADIFEGAIEDRAQHKIPFGEQMMLMDEHKRCADSLRHLQVKG